jgi:hypothetical protein
MMADRPIDWTRLADLSLLTTTGARFTVVRVTARAVTVRPEKGSREYALSIPNELERAVAAYRKGHFFPSPADLQRAGFGSILSSYTWAVLRAVLFAETQENRGQAAFQEKDLVGMWRITSLEIDDDYLAEGDEPPSIVFDRMNYGSLSGRYRFGPSGGELTGHLRKFGGEPVLLFDFAGWDEMDEVTGSGWAQLTAPNQLEGEFLNDYGRFVAEPDVRKSKGVRRRGSIRH